MQTRILVGTKEKQEEYLDHFKKEQEIPLYLQLSYEEFKISDARNLQKTISLRLKQNERRLIVISSPTIEAQQALLKTIEELPIGNYLFFLVFSIDDLLPTIQSRCHIITFDKVDSKEEVKSIPEIIHKQEVTLEDLEEALLFERSRVITAVKNQEVSQVLLQSLKNFHKNYKLAKNNNVNKRLVLEIAFSGAMS